MRMVFLFWFAIASQASAATDLCRFEILQFEKWSDTTIVHFQTLGSALKKRSNRTIGAAIGGLQGDLSSLNRIQVQDPGLKEVRKIFTAMLESELKWGNSMSRLVAENRAAGTEEFVRIDESRQRSHYSGVAALTVLAIFKAQPCRSPASIANAASASQFQHWANSFRTTTGTVDSLMSSLAESRTTPSLVKKELEKLAAYWRGSLPFVSSGRVSLGSGALKARALYAEEIKLMLEMSEIAINAFERGNISVAERERIGEIAGVTRIIGHVADRLSKM